MPLPPTQPPADRTAWVVCAIGSTFRDTLRLACQVPDSTYLVVMMRAVHIQELQAQLQEPMAQHSLTRGITVGCAVGTPLGLQNWPETEKGTPDFCLRSLACSTAPGATR